MPPTPAGPASLPATRAQKAGKEATGQLANIAKKAGFGSGGLLALCWHDSHCAALAMLGCRQRACMQCPARCGPRPGPLPSRSAPLPPPLHLSAVRDLLEKNPHAKALQLPKLPPGGGSAGASGSRAGAGSQASREGSAAPGGQGGEGSGVAAGAQRKRPAQKRKPAAEEAEKELVADEQLPPRAAEMPVGVGRGRPAAGWGGAWHTPRSLWVARRLRRGSALAHAALPHAHLCAGGAPAGGAQGAGRRPSRRQAAARRAGLGGRRA